VDGVVLGKKRETRKTYQDYKQETSSVFFHTLTLTGQLYRSVK
jgi:hypothetical protein